MSKAVKKSLNAFAGIEPEGKGESQYRKTANVDTAEPDDTPDKGKAKRGATAGLQDGWERWTVTARSDYVQKLKDYAYTERLSVKEAVDEMFSAFLADKTDLKRKER